MQRYGQPRRGSNDNLMSGEIAKATLPLVTDDVQDVIDAKNVEIAMLNSTVADQSADIDTLNQTVADKDATIAAKDAEIAGLRVQLDDCEASKS